MKENYNVPDYGPAKEYYGQERDIRGNDPLVGVIKDIATPFNRTRLKRIDEYTKGLSDAVRKDQTYDELKSSVICLANALRNIVSYLKEVEKDGTDAT